MKKKEYVIIGILTILAAFMEITGLPCRLISVEVLDIMPIYWSLLADFVLIGSIVFFTLKYFVPSWDLGLRKRGFGSGARKYGGIGIAVGIAVGIASGIAFYIGLKPLNNSPTVAKVLIECILYYFGVAFVEELYIRGLLLNLLEKMFSKNEKNTSAAILVSSAIFGVGHIFGAIGQPISVVCAKVVWTVAMGIYFGAIYKKTENLWLPIVLHFIMDIGALPYCFSTMQGYPDVSVYILLPIYIALGIYGFYITTTLRKDMRRKKPIS